MDNKMKLGFYVFTAALVIITSMLVYGIHQNDVATTQSHRALCAQKHQYESNVQATKAYIKQHPNGTADFSKAFLDHSLVQAEKILSTYQDITCS